MEVVCCLSAYISEKYSPNFSHALPPSPHLPCRTTPAPKTPPHCGQEPRTCRKPPCTPRNSTSASKTRTEGSTAEGSIRKLPGDGSSSRESDDYMERGGSNKETGISGEKEEGAGREGGAGRGVGGWRLNARFYNTLKRATCTQTLKYRFKV